MTSTLRRSTRRSVARAPALFGRDVGSPGAAMAALAVAYTMACAAAAGYLAGLISRRAEIAQALALGTLGARATLVIIAASPRRRTFASGTRG